MLPRVLITALLALGVWAGAGLAGDGPPALIDACGSASNLNAQPLWLTTADGVRLWAIEAGDGPVVAVLAHQGRSDLCEELPYAQTLVAAGLRVLAFDFRGYGRSGQPSQNRSALGLDLSAAVARARQDGAGHVFLIGASMGGAAVVQNSGGLPVDGLISLSGTRLWTEFGVNRPGPTALRAPFLYVGSRSDFRAPLREALAVFRAVGSHDKRTAFYRGYLHGWQLVQAAPYAARTRALIMAWIHAHS